MRRVCIVHFHELEKFPPAINFIKTLDSLNQSALSTLILTTKGDRHFEDKIGNIKIHFLVKWEKRMNKMHRMWKYLQFNVAAIIRIIKFRPDAILYYETLSAAPPLLYKKFFKKSTEIFAHYHEYISQHEYESGMALNRWLHHLELRWYSRIDWVSQTNNDRLNLFLKDIAPLAPSSTHVVPNYPPNSWKKKPGNAKQGITRFVYVGALSLETMYVKEMAEFICSHKNECTWDIYSVNLSEEVISYLESTASNTIQYKGGVPYERLPDILARYDVGLVLYKGHIPNYVYNVPNKLFEYHVCGLDVWFPATMKSSLPYLTQGTYPKILSIDFNQLASLNLRESVDHSNLTEYQHAFFYEKAFEPLAEKLIHGNAQSY
jgi:hypothetical protein